MTNNDADIQTVEQTSIDEETVTMTAFARVAAEALTKAYKHHIWMVGWHPGMVLCVKNMIIPGNYGYTIDCRTIATSSELERLAIRAGGELLERCGMVRGAWNGEMATHVEGADPRRLAPI